MRKLIIGIVTALILIFIVPEAGMSQLAAKKKHSEELTKTAINLYKAQRVDEAKIKLLRAVKLYNKNVLAHEMLSLVYYKEKNFPEAIKHANKAISLNSKSARAYYVLGMISYQQGDIDKAKFELNRSVKYIKNPERKRQALTVLEKIKKRLKDRKPVVRNKIKSFGDKSEPTESATGYKPYVAIFNFENANARTEESQLGETLTEMLATAFIQSGKFNVMERVQLEKVLSEQSLAQSGAIDTRTAIEVGKLAGLQAVVLGSISQLKNSIEADARLIEVETGRALAAASGKVTNVDKIRNLANSLAKQLASKANLIVPKADST